MPEPTLTKTEKQKTTTPTRDGSRGQTRQATPSGPVAEIMNLQNALGNRAVGQVLQAKLKINQPGDKYEREADRVAEMVMRMPDSAVSGLSQRPETVQRKCAACASGKGTCAKCAGEENKLLQRKITAAAPQVTPGIAANINALRGFGQPLPESTRFFFEQRFGVDFSGVRIHNNNQVAKSAKAINAKAFTINGNIFFDKGQYQLESHEGKSLLAHELTHTIQQGFSGQNTSTFLSKRENNFGKHDVRPLLKEKRSSTLGEIQRAPDTEPMFSGTVVIHGKTPQGFRTLGGWRLCKYESTNKCYVVYYDVKVGTKQDWLKILNNVDNHDEYVKYLYGFLQAVDDPLYLPGLLENRRGWKNTLFRTPTQNEIMEFMRALYSLGGPLDLPSSEREMDKIRLIPAQELLSRLIRKYQHLIIHEYTLQRLKPVKSSGVASPVIPEKQIKEVAGQGGAPVREAMIESAGATAMKGIDVLAAAKGDVARLSATELIRNAGRTIRYTLKVHNAKKSSFAVSILEALFDNVWRTIPGGNVLAKTAKGILKKGFKQMMFAATKDSSPSRQAEKINSQFIATVHILVKEGVLNATDANAAINGFEAVRR